MSNYDLHKQYWHVVQNDETGGWAVTNYDTDVTSKLDHRLGHVVVAEVLSKGLAMHIASLHNKYLDYNVQDSFSWFLDEMEILVRVNGKKLVAREVVQRGEDVLAYILSLKSLTYRVEQKLREEFRNGDTDDLPGSSGLGQEH